MKNYKFIFIFFFFVPQFAQGQFLFQDATIPAGISMISTSVSEVAPGVVVFDLNGDGLDDLYLPGGNDSDKIFLNMHDGTFKNVVPENIATHSSATNAQWHIHPRGGIAFDYDNDGFTDIYFVCEGDDVLWHNNGDGTFTDVTRYPARLNFPLDQNESMSATFGDFNGDGYNDFYVARFLGTGKSSPNWFYVNNHNGSFTERGQEFGIDNGLSGSIVALFFDYDRDGDLDLLIGNDSMGINHVYKNMLMETGVATFRDVSDSIGMGGTFFCHSITPCDYDNDGNFDFYESAVGSDSLMRNNGNGTFTNTASTVLPVNNSISSHGTVISGDFDNDGWEDEFISSFQGLLIPDTSLFYQNINGEFHDNTSKSMNGNYLILHGGGAAYFDFNHDGKLDLCANSVNSDPSSTLPSFHLLQNITPDNTSGHWLEMRFTATRTAKEAIGTIVDVWAGGIVHSRQVSTGGGFASQNSLMQHVGLGKFSKADSIIVYWPANKDRYRQIDRYFNVNADTILHFVESMPQGVLSSQTHSLVLMSSPNPFTKETTLDFTISKSSDLTIAIYDELDRLVWQKKSEMYGEGAHQIYIDGAAFPIGVLYAKIRSESGELMMLKLMHSSR